MPIRDEHRARRDSKGIKALLRECRDYTIDLTAEPNFDAGGLHVQRAACAFPEQIGPHFGWALRVVHNCDSASSWRDGLQNLKSLAVQFRRKS
jgi:hypothetical protein